MAEKRQPQVVSHQLQLAEGTALWLPAHRDSSRALREAAPATLRLFFKTHSSATFHRLPPALNYLRHSVPHELSDDNEDVDTSLERDKISQPQEEVEAPFHHKGDTLLTPEDCRVIARKRDKTSIAQSLEMFSNFATTQGQIRRILTLPLPPDARLLVQLVYRNRYCPRTSRESAPCDGYRAGGTALHCDDVAAESITAVDPPKATHSTFLSFMHRQKSPPLPLRLPDALADNPLNQLSEATTHRLTKSLAVLNRPAQATHGNAHRHDSHGPARRQSRTSSPSRHGEDRYRSGVASRGAQPLKTAAPAVSTARRPYVNCSFS